MLEIPSHTKGRFLGNSYSKRQFVWGGTLKMHLSGFSSEKTHIIFAKKHEFLQTKTRSNLCLRYFPIQSILFSRADFSEVVHITSPNCDKQKWLKFKRFLFLDSPNPVSYTHLTLPTICSV